jgi:hypothetical protein
MPVAFLQNICSNDLAGIEVETAVNLTMSLSLWREFGSLRLYIFYYSFLFNI